MPKVSYITKVKEKKKTHVQKNTKTQQCTARTSDYLPLQINGTVEKPYLNARHDENESGLHYLLSFLQPSRTISSLSIYV